MGNYADKHIYTQPQYMDYIAQDSGQQRFQNIRSQTLMIFSSLAGEK